MPENNAQGQKTVLCVDDDESLLATLRRLLRPLPYQVLSARTGKEALLLAASKRPDLIITDLRMPEMDGFEMIDALRSQGLGDIPFVMLTADSRPGGILKGYGEGCLYYITKPFKNEHVQNIVQYLIGDLSEQERVEIEKNL